MKARPEGGKSSLATIMLVLIFFRTWSQRRGERRREKQGMLIRVIVFDHVRSLCFLWKKINIYFIEMFA